MGQSVCLHCGQGIAEHAMRDAYLPDLRRCPGFEASVVATDPSPNAVEEALRKAVRIIARLENDRRTREGQDFLAEARKALG